MKNKFFGSVFGLFGLIFLFFALQGNAIAGIPTAKNVSLDSNQASGATLAATQTPAPSVKSALDFLGKKISGIFDIFNGSKVSANENKAALLIEHQDGTIKTACIAFSEENITGLDVLNRSGFKISEDGGMIKSLDGEDAPPYDANNPKFWSYFREKDGKWEMSMEGAGTAKVINGGLEGWKLGGGEAPKYISFDEICGADAQKTQTVVPPRIKGQSNNFPWQMVIVMGCLLVGLVFGWVWFFRSKEEK